MVLRSPFAPLVHAASGSPARNGFTFIELLVVTTILLILASAVMPLARVTVQRQREAELRRALREMRTAIDKYKDAVDNGLIGSIDIKAGSEGYPPDLETLVEGVGVANDATGREAEVSPARADRSDQRGGRVGDARVRRQARLRRRGAGRTSTTSTRSRRARRSTGRSTETGEASRVSGRTRSRPATKDSRLTTRDRYQ